MRALTKALVSVTAAVGIAAGGLATAGTAMAATSPAPSSAVAASPAAVAAYNNLGLTKYQAYGVQCFLNTNILVDLEVDGYLGEESWEAIQNFLNNNWDQSLDVDGIVGPATIKGLQYFLKKGGWGYTGALDGIAGSGTRAAFARFGQSNLEQFCE